MDSWQKSCSPGVLTHLQPGALDQQHGGCFEVPTENGQHQRGGATAVVGHAPHPAERTETERKEICSNYCSLVVFNYV